MTERYGHFFQVVYLPDRDYQGMHMPSEYFGEDERDAAQRFYDNLRVPYKALWEVDKGQYSEHAEKLRQYGSYLVK